MGTKVADGAGVHSIPIGKIVRLNALLILAIGLYGLATDEPYWRANGHGPYLYDYLFWCALALNGPSGFAADYLAWLITSSGSNFQLQFLLQYALWLLLLWPQWKAYAAVVTWCMGHRGREVALYIAVAVIVVVGSYAAYEGWVYGHRPRELAWIDRYFWFVRMAGLALSGLIILACSQFSKNVVRSALRRPV